MKFFCVAPSFLPAALLFGACGTPPSLSPVPMTSADQVSVAPAQAASSDGTIPGCPPAGVVISGDCMPSVGKDGRLEPTSAGCQNAQTEAKRLKNLGCKTEVLIGI